MKNMIEFGQIIDELIVAAENQDQDAFMVAIGKTKPLMEKCQEEGDLVTALKIVSFMSGLNEEIDKIAAGGSH